MPMPKSPRIFASFILRLLFADLRKPPPVPLKLITLEQGVEEGRLVYSPCLQINPSVSWLGTWLALGGAIA
jgi:hypothetical protein